jgi:uncharacterized protein YndB with AHSA1/START domain
MSDTQDREITTTRLFDAPRELVWRVWTEPEHIAQWWGPNGFTNTIQSMDVRPDGVWEFVMHGPDGRNYPNRIVYREVNKPSRLVYEHGPAPKFEVTVTFEEEGARKTRIHMRMLFGTAKERDQVIRDVGAIEGLNQTLGRLAEHLASLEENA